MTRALALSVLMVTVTVAAQSTWTSVASFYRSWARIGDERPMMGPLDCPFAVAPEPEAHPRRSQAERGEHSRKAFFLYVNDEAAYRATVRRDAEPVEGLTIVKETYRPRDLGPYDDRRSPVLRMPVPSELQRGSETVSYRARLENNRWLGVGEPVGLFVMQYRDSRWRFATVHFDGRVENSGAMPQCVRCHRTAPHHGVFGAGL